MLKNLCTSAIILFLISSHFLVFAQEGLDKIVNPKTNGTGYVSNADHILSNETVAKLNALIKPLNENGKAQVAVVLVNSIGDQVPKDFSTALLRKWGIGDRKKNNGLLILFVADQRRIEFEVGYGLEGLLTDLTCQRIQQGLMIPYFKKGDYNTGVLKGVELVVETIDTGVDQSLDEDNLYPELGWVLFQDILFFLVYIGAYSAYTTSQRGQYVVHSASGWWVPFLLFGPLIIVSVVALATPIFVMWDLFFLISYCCWSVFFSFAIGNMLASEPVGETRVQQYQYLKLMVWGFTVYAVLFPLPFLIFKYIGAKRRLRKLRYTPYQSPDSGAEMVLMKKNRALELTDKEQMEEKLGSVSYDLWEAGEGDPVMKLAYLNQNTKIRRCKKCLSITAKKTKRIVESKATTKGEGIASVYYTCQICGKSDFINQPISRKPQLNIFKGMFAAGLASSGDSNSSSSDRSSSSSSSSSSDSSSSSSSSSDWGGGSSGGGGSGSSW